MRIIFVIGTRPEAIKCFPVIEELRSRSGVEVVVCATGQHREIFDEAMEVLGFKSDIDLKIMRPSPTLNEITSDVLQGVGRVFAELRPDLALVQGDTTTAMAAGLAAFYARVPLGHIEAGLMTGTKFSPYPEEMNRSIVAVLADIHFSPTPAARDNLRQNNVPADRIHVTGNTVIDTLLATKRRLDKIGNVRPSIRSAVETAAGKKLILVTAHRRENWGSGIDAICEAARWLADRGDVHIAFPVHPNPLVREPVYRALGDVAGVSLLDPLDYLSFVDLMRRSYIVLTDSGGVQEEAPTFGKPVLVLRDTTERPEGIDAGAARLVGLDPLQIFEEAERLLDGEAAYRQMSRHQSLYGDGRASQRIADIIEASIAPKTGRSSHGKRNATSIGQVAEEHYASRP